MKLNRKRKDARFPQWVLEGLATIQMKYQWNFTEALMRCAEKGMAYYNKQWEKMHGKEKPVEGTGQDQRCPNESPKKNLPQENDLSDEEYDILLAAPNNEERKRLYQEMKQKQNGNRKIK